MPVMYPCQPPQEQLVCTCHLGTAAAAPQHPVYHRQATAYPQQYEVSHPVPPSVYPHQQHPNPLPAQPVIQHSHPSQQVVPGAATTDVELVTTAAGSDSAIEGVEKNTQTKTR